MNLGLAIESQRVSIHEIYMIVTRWPNRPSNQPIWALWDLSGPVARCLDMGRGEPPAKHYPV